MKRLLAIFLILITLFTFCACKNEAPVATITPTPTTAPTDEPTLEPTQEPTLAPTEAPTLTPDLTPALTPTPTATIGPIDLTNYTVMYVAGSVVNVREGASTGNKKITSLPINSEVKSYKQLNGWHYISYDDNRFGFTAVSSIN